MKNLNKKILYVWACDFSKSRGEGLLARNFVKNISLHTNKKIYVNGIKYKILKNRSLNIKVNIIHNYFLPFFGIFKIWKAHLYKHKTIYLNYLPLWNFLIFFLLPKKTILGPITGGSNYLKSNNLNFFIRKYIFPFLYIISLRIIKKKFDKVIFSTDLLKKYITEKKNFTFNYCLNIFEKKNFRNKKKYDVIFYYRKNSNKNNFETRKLINKLIKDNFKVVAIGDNPNLKKLFYAGNINREKALKFISKSKFAFNNNENMYSLFCIDSLSCGTQVIYFGKKNYKENFFTKGSIIQKEISDSQMQYLFLKKILSKRIIKIKEKKNFFINKNKIKDYFLNIDI